MGRRKPQMDVLLAEQEFTQEGAKLPFCGFVADSGYDMHFAGETNDEPILVISLSGKWSRYEPPEWQVIYSRKVGDYTYFHERSSVSGRARFGKVRDKNTHIKLDILHRTIEASNRAHTVTSERKAQSKLRTHLSSSNWRSYVLTGSFYEISERSGLAYFFRKTAPTVVCKVVKEEEGFSFKPFLTLCMHPVGYSAYSGAGCMCPTDDMISHLLLMRADEHAFWKKAAHHSIDDPLSML